MRWITDHLDDRVTRVRRDELLVPGRSRIV